MTALTIVNELAHHGIQVYWGGESLRLRGDLHRLREEHKQALRDSKEDLEALVKWQSLQGTAEAAYGGLCSRFYPFMALNLEDCIPLRSTIGEVRIAQVMPDFLRVVKEDDMKEWERESAVKGKRLPYPTPMIRLEFHQVSPPVDAPGQQPNDFGTLEF